MTALAWFIILVIAGIICIGLEIFIPGGIIGTLGIVALFGAIYLAFAGDFMSLPGAIGTTMAILAATGFSIYAWLKYFPKSRMGKDIFLDATIEGSSSLDDGLKELLGAEGAADSALRPAGYALINGQKVDVVTEGNMIEKGEKVKVVKVEGSRVVVRGLES